MINVFVYILTFGVDKVLRISFLLLAPIIIDPIFLGEYVLFMGLYAFFGVYFISSAPALVVKESKSAVNFNKRFYFYLFFVLVALILCGVINEFFSFLERFDFISFVLLALSFPFHVLLSLRFSEIRVMGLGRKESYLRSIFYPLVFFLVIYLGVSEYQGVAVSLGFLIASLVTLIYVSYIERGESQVQELIKDVDRDFLFNMTSIGMILVIVSQIDKFVIAVFLDKSNVALYSIIISLTVIPSMLLSAINPYFITVFSKYKEDSGFVINFYSGYVVVLGSLAIILFPFIEWFIKEYFIISRADYNLDPSVISLCVKLGIFATLYNVITGPLASMLQYGGKHRLDFRLSVFQVLIAIAVSPVLIKFYGFEGAFYSYIISNIFINLIRFYFVRRQNEVGVGFLFLCLIYYFIYFFSGFLVVSVLVSIFFSIIFIFIYKDRVVFFIRGLSR
ncbi:polysaccharide biosynthesis C-terminal domain-containing protein [Litoribrevibacter albus]|uniref:Uncharacterized protein n=1 Tax=Litoribrevibacter albus TaxID=1473156 RepID=A0AA37W811_9GAMM|nr:polysaccharide biosynthesis C-terminal domain-containing protein [Litoribrevibacter albus]GLQ33207.1 hypothetical protein GCM10007876_36870 [Litoribrevibacter albus]